MNGFSNLTNDELSETFASMFLDSQIAKSCGLRRTKSIYTPTYVLAPLFKFFLGFALEQIDIHVYLFD